MPTQQKIIPISLKQIEDFEKISPLLNDISPANAMGLLAATHRMTTDLAEHAAETNQAFTNEQRSFIFLATLLNNLDQINASIGKENSNSLNENKAASMSATGESY